MKVSNLSKLPNDGAHRTTVRYGWSALGIASEKNWFGTFRRSGAAQHVRRSIDADRIDNLQVLRAFAAIVVIVHHIIDVYGPSYGVGTWLLPLATLGASGVDLFFVISGFIMVYTQEHRPRTTYQFLRARVVRIVPAYWIATLLWLSYLVATSEPETFAVLVHWTLVSLAFLSGTVFEHYPILNIGWTLEYELLFYVIFGLSVSFSKSYVVTALMIILLVLFTDVGPIALEFVFGMVIAYLHLRQRWHPAIGAALIVAGFILLVASLQFELNGTTRVLFWGLPCALIVAGALCVRQFPAGLWTWLGCASYSIYLTHWLSLHLFDDFIQLFPWIHFNPNVTVLIGVFACTAIGAVFYVLVERPLSKL